MAHFYSYYRPLRSWTCVLFMVVLTTLNGNSAISDSTVVEVTGNKLFTAEDPSRILKFPEFGLSSDKTDNNSHSAEASPLSNPPVISFISGDGLNCEGDCDGNILITVTGGTPFSGPYPYQFDWDWSETGGNDDYACSCPSGEFEDLSNLCAGIYYVTVTDAAGLTAVAQAEVTEPQQGITITGDDIELDCFGNANGEMNVTVTGGTPDPFSGGYNYDWDFDGTGANDDMGGPADPTDDDENPTDLGPGIYSVTVTDFLGCTSTMTFSVTEPPELTASASSEAVECAGESTGSADLDVQGGTAPFNFDWDNDGTGDNDDPEDLADVPAGTYNVTVTDDNGCTATATIEIIEPSEAVQATIDDTFDSECFGADNGSIDLTPSGGSGNYTFDWSNDGTGDNDDPEDLTDLPPGSYSVTVTDANGCTAVASVDINEPPEITTTLDTTICTGGSLVIGGEVFDESNTSGEVVLTAANGCDSTVTINLSFDPPPMTDETYEGCEGDGYEVVVNGTTYNEGNPTGTETITTAEGCDSIVTVTLTFTPGVTGEETYEGCEGDGYEVVVNGMTYNEGTPSGTETLVSGDGCDSVVTITLVFNPPTESTISNEGCTGDGFSVTVNGTVYNEGNPTGEEIIQNENGCDSTITIDLQFGTPSDTTINYDGCEGDGYSITVNGVLYNESNPTGTEVTTNNDGCDSTITVALVFTPPIEETIEYDGCTGDGYEVIVNGTAYNESNPTGEETMVSQATGCDSIVTINLTFGDETYGEETYVGCTGDGYDVTVNGTIYNEANPTGEETLVSIGGCDSIVTIDLVFNDHTTGELLYDGCTGDGYFVIINGTNYNENNRDGVETIPNANGCDSVVTIDLDFAESSEEFLTYDGCEGDGYSVVVNGETYNESNPTGVEVIPNAGGCDSTINIDFVYHPNTEETIVHYGCTGDGFSVVVNGTIYNEANPAGTENMISSFGCDSTIQIDLIFNDDIIIDFDTTLCTGGQVEIGGIIFDESNPTGIVDLVADAGCDSTINVTLIFTDLLTSDELYEGCTGDGYFVVVNGNVYDESNPDGTELMTTSNGCDSLVTIALQFNDLVSTEFETTLCLGESIEINGTIYDIDNPGGTEIIPGDPCDTVMQVIIEFLDASETFVTYEGCQGDGYEVEVNGTNYNESNPLGVETVSVGTGCDSVINVELVFHPHVFDTISRMGCFGDGYSVEVNGTIYDESNQTGTEFMQTGEGCDSTVTIELLFGDTVITDYEYVGCEGDGFEVTIGSGTYNEASPTGTEYFTTSGGCDSIVNVDLIFLLPDTFDLIETLCAGDSIIVNGTVYNEDNPDGIEVISTSQCDSVVNVQLYFQNLIETSVTYQGCFGDGYEVTVNGTIYNESNPNGVELLESGGGCDSVITVALVFQDCCAPITTDLQDAICEGQSIDFGNITISTGGVYKDTFPDALGPGCDSIVVLTLEIYDVPIGVESKTVCRGDAFDFFGDVIFDEGSYSHTIPGGASSGCDSVVTLELSVEELPMAEAGSAEKITCSNNSVTLSGNSSVADVAWIGPDIAGTFSGAQVNIGVPGWYFFECTSPNGCVASDSVLVEAAEDVPVASGLTDGNIDCAHDSVHVWVEYSGSNVMFEWTGPGTPGGQVDVTGFMTATAGVYTVMAIDMVSSCTSSVDTIVVLDLEEEIEPIVVGGGMLTCDNNSVMLDGSTSAMTLNSVVEWIDSEGNMIGNDVMLEVSTPGEYTLVLTDSISSCTGQTTVMVEADDDVPVVDAGEPQELSCAVDNVTLVGNSSVLVDVVYSWHGPDGGVMGSTDHLTADVMLPGMYYFTVTDTMTLCTNMDSVQVVENMDAPFAFAGADITLTCDELGTMLDASGSNGNGDIGFYWSGPGIIGIDSSITLMVDMPGEYVLMAMNMETGCADYDSVMVMLPEGIDGAVVEFESPACYGESNGFVIVEDIIGGVSPYTITIDGSEVDGNFVDTLSAGMHSVYIVDENGCSWETTVTLDEGTLANVSAGPDLVIDIGASANLTFETSLPSEYIDSIIWGPSNLLSCSICPSPTASLFEEAMFSVTLVTVDGCSATDSLNIFVKEEIDYYIPNVFTPNSDGTNDQFTLYANEQPVMISDMLVYDRWGEQVFRAQNIQSNDPMQGWDGHFNGAMLQPGVYTYLFVIDDDGENERSTLSGDVTIIR